MRFPSKAVKIIIFFLLLPLISPFILHAGGRGEQESLQKLRRAEKLIEEKDYNQAIILLTEVARSDPDKFEAVEKLMQKIRRIRTEYNRLYEDLINALFEDYDPERALDLIAELQELDPNPNEATEKALARAKAGTEIVHFLKRFEEIMDTGLALLKGEKYTEAIENYLSGYSLGKENFDKADYGTIIKNSVEISLKSLLESSGAFKTRARGFDEEARPLRENLSNLQIERLDEDIKPVRSSLVEIVTLQNRVEEAAVNFGYQNQQIKKTHKDGEYDLFLHFADQLAMGREAAEHREGIVSAMELWWELALSDLNLQILRAGDVFYSMGVESFKNRDHFNTQANMQKANKVFFTALDIQTQWAMGLKLTSPYTLSDPSKTLVKNQAPNFLLVQEKLRQIRDYLVLIDMDIKIVDLLEAEAEFFDEFISARDQLLKYREEMTNLKKGWQDWTVRYNEVALLGYDLSEHKRQAEGMISEIDSIFGHLEAADVRFVDSITRLGMEGWVESFNAANKKYEDGLVFKRGIEVEPAPITDEEGNVVETPIRIEKYPDRALEIFEPLVGEATQIKDLIDKQLLTESGDDYLVVSKELQTILAGVINLKDKVESLQKDLDRNIEEARKDVFQAERLKGEGNLRLEKAKTNIAQENFQQARDNIKSAGEAFNLSLSFRENPEVRSIIDRTLRDLSYQIVQAENRRVVREVRAFIKDGRKLYDQNDFFGAEQVMLRAQYRWAETNIEENKEITGWLDTIRLALSANTGRTIAEKDPLYTELTQLYNLAAEDLLAARELLDQGRQREAIERLRRAEEKLTRIKELFPYNREARNLSLLILQLEAKEGFAERLTLLYNEAMLKIKGGNNQDAYADLLDLQQFQPDYPGLKKALYSLEIDLGLRTPPPDPAKIKRSVELTDQAKPIVDKRERDLYPVALELLNKAIELDPDNTQAIEIKDDIQLALGGTRKTVLSSDADRQYREAEKKFLQGNYFEALAIVERLLRDPGNKEYKPLLELKKRIDTKI